MRELDVCLELLLAWLTERHGRSLSIERREEPAPEVVAAEATDGSLRLAVEAHSLLGPVESAGWLGDRERLEAEIAAGLEGAYALWLPPGADLPGPAGERNDLVRRVREAAAPLEPGERSYVPLPVSIFLRKTQAGGLADLGERGAEPLLGTPERAREGLLRPRQHEAAPAPGVR